jgi:DNA-binding response OmpR family regulator
MMIQSETTILVIEDDKPIQSLLAEFLSSAGYKVLVADNGLNGLKVIQEQGMPNLILLDMMMPVMDGSKFGEEFLNKYKNPCPIIVMSAAIDVEDRAKALNAAAYVIKPYIFDNMLELVGTHTTN